MAQWDEIIPGSFGLLITGGAAGYFLWQWARVLASKRWPTVQGKIESSRVVTRQQTKSKLHHAEVAYTYEVAGRYYKAHRICFGDRLTGNPGIAQERVRKFSAKSGATVHYNPKNPADATLLPQGTLMMAVYPALALFVFGAILAELL